MSFAAVHIPEFPAATWRRSSPELRSQPCVVLEGVPPQEKVVSRCERGGAAGIEHGMSKVQAEAGYPVVFRSRQIKEEKAAFAIAVEVAEGFSPRVEAVASPMNGYAEAHRPAVVLLIDSSGTGTLFGSAESYAQRYTANFGPQDFQPASVPRRTPKPLSYSHEAATRSSVPTGTACGANFPDCPLPCCPANRRRWRA